MKILLLGSSGRLGRHVADAILRSGYSLRVLLHRTAPRRKDVPQGLEIVWGSMGDSEAVRAAVQGVDAVVHSARSSAFGAASKGGANETTAGLLFEKSLQAGVKKFAFVSSVVVFGMQSRLPEPISEASPILRESEATFDYPREKIAIEAQLQSLSANNAIQVGIFRPGPIIDKNAGPGVKITTVFGSRIALGIGDGANRMPYIHGADVADAIIRWVRAGEASAQYNVVPSQCLSRREWAVAWCRVHQKDARPVFLRKPVARLLFQGKGVVKRLLGKATDRGATYALITETRDLVYANDRLKNDLAWDDAWTSEYWRMADSSREMTERFGED